MKNQEIRAILIKELGVETLPEEAQDEIISKIGDTILKSLTARIFERLSTEDHKKFEIISKTGDDERIQEFLEIAVPNMHSLMEEEIKKTIRLYKEKEEETIQ